jgi:hypothetical protein
LRARGYIAPSHPFDAFQVAVTLVYFAVAASDVTGSTTGMLIELPRAVVACRA